MISNNSHFFYNQKYNGAALSPPVNQAESSTHIRFNPDVTVIGMFGNELESRTVIPLKYGEKGDHPTYHEYTDFKTSRIGRRKLGRPEDTYGTEQQRLQQQAHALTALRWRQCKGIHKKRSLQLANRERETFNRSELIDLLTSSLRRKNIDLSALSTRQLMQKFQRFAMKVSKFPCADRGIKIRTYNKGRSFELEYNHIPPHVLRIQS